jgi:hypothetical protein
MAIERVIISVSIRERICTTISVHTSRIPTFGFSAGTRFISAKKRKPWQLFLRLGLVSADIYQAAAPDLAMSVGGDNQLPAYIYLMYL